MTFYGTNTQYAIRNTAENEPELGGGQLGDGAMWRLSAHDRLGTHGRDHRQRQTSQSAIQERRKPEAGSRNLEEGKQPMKKEAKPK